MCVICVRVTCVRVRVCHVRDLICQATEALAACNMKDLVTRKVRGTEMMTMMMMMMMILLLLLTLA